MCVYEHYKTVLVGACRVGEGDEKTSSLPHVKSDPGCFFY